MLVELSIANLAIIDELRMELGSGFTVLTGETGAGKSIIIDAVSLLLGERASADLIRTGRDEASVEGVFDLSPQVWEVLRPSLEDLGLDEGSDMLILRRSVSRERRNICRVNGHAVPLAAFQEIGRHLIDIHGQGEHLSLMQARNHIDFLDRYAGLGAQRQALAAEYEALRRVRAEMHALTQDAREVARRVDLLSYQVAEIEAARLQPDEEEELKRERSLLANAEKLKLHAAEAYRLLIEGQERQPSVTDQLSAVVDNLTALTKMDDSLADSAQQAEDALYTLEELGRSLRGYRDAVEYNPKRLEEVEERADLLLSLKLKYGDSIADILAYAARASAELDAITHSEERMNALQAREGDLLARLAEMGQQLSVARAEAALRLKAHMERELGELSMERSQFLVDCRWVEDPHGVLVDGRRYAVDATGMDRIEFLIAANPGEEPKPLVKTASGGETSRLMLALKTALATADTVPTLIFDEIDAGIGGRTGAVVGHKLWSLAADHQVLCVTHLAQIASYGHRHYRVSKAVVGERTVSSARLLSREERVEELAVMLGGADTESTRRSAAEMIARVTETALEER
ncbi:MAG: DNA repair protein RecN [Anaerolineae bacterium]